MEIFLKTHIYIYIFKISSDRTANPSVQRIIKKQTFPLKISPIPNHPSKNPLRKLDTPVIDDAKEGKMKMIELSTTGIENRERRAVPSNAGRN